MFLLDFGKYLSDEKVNKRVNADERTQNFVTVEFTEQLNAMLRNSNCLELYMFEDRLQNLFKLHLLHFMWRCCKLNNITKI